MCVPSRRGSVAHTTCPSSPTSASPRRNARPAKTDRSNSSQEAASAALTAGIADVATSALRTPATMASIPVPTVCALRRASWRISSRRAARSAASLKACISSGGSNAAAMISTTRLSRLNVDAPPFVAPGAFPRCL